MNKMAKNNKMPVIRFSGYTNVWEQRKLGEIFEYLQNNTLSRDSLNYKNPNVKNIHYGDILVKFDEILDGASKDIPYINSELDLSKFSKSLLRDGDIIFSDTAEDDTVGKAIELQNVNAPFILSGLHTIPCRPIIPFGKGYLGNFLNSDSYRMQLRPLVQGIKVSSISKSALKDTMIEYPKNLDEQERIGSLFQNIAKMITLHQRKLEKLKLTKKALLQKLFPQNGSKLPELRFKGFTDAWEQRKFLDLLDAQNGIRRGPFGSALKKDSFVKKSDYVVYEQQNAIYDNYETRYFISKEKYNELIRFNIQPGDFIMSGAGTIGRISMVPDGIKKGVFNQALIRFKVNKDSINPLYFLKFMQSDMMQKQLTQANPGSAMTNLVPMDELKKWDVTIPSLEEQNRISTFINQIDAFITLHHRKLEMLKNVKKGLLQKMFV